MKYLPTTRKARKSRTCEGCGCLIYSGETYKRSAIPLDGTMLSIDLCLDCHDILVDLDVENIDCPDNLLYIIDQIANANSSLARMEEQGDAMHMERFLHDREEAHFTNKEV